MSAAPLLHIYAQDAWHDDAFIVGEPEALRALRSAIDRALADRNAAVEAMVADGEGYHVLVLCRPPEAIEGMKMPYTDPLTKDNMEGMQHPLFTLTPDEYERLTTSKPDEGDDE